MPFPYAFAVVELMGHLTHVGAVEEVTVGTATMLRISHPPVTVPRSIARREWRNGEEVIVTYTGLNSYHAEDVIVAPASIYRVRPAESLEAAISNVSADETTSQEQSVIPVKRLDVAWETESAGELKTMLAEASLEKQEPDEEEPF